MTFNPKVWYPIATGLSIVNWAGVGFAAAQAEPWHAAFHAGLGLVFALWAQRLRWSRGAGTDLQAGLEALEIEVSKLRQELTESQERMDFAERLLAQAPETRRVDRER